MDSFADFQAIANDGTAIHGTDRSAIVRFEQVAIEDEEATAQSGQVKYRNVDMIFIRFAGSNNETVREVLKQDTPTQLSDIKRFPSQWQAFINQREQVPDGYPLEQWAVLNKAQALNLKSMGIHTVEQLAGISDANLSFMGARQMRDNAIAWLEDAENGSASIKLRAENESLKLEIEALKNQLKAIGEIKGQKVDEELDSPTPILINQDEEIKPLKRMAKKQNG